MNRREFFGLASMLSAAGLLSSTGSAQAGETRQPTITTEQLKPVQRKMGYSDAEMKQFLANPRNLKVLSRLKELSRVNLVFEIVKASGCLVEHRIGERFIFPAAGKMDTARSAPKLCPFLMPPMTRMAAIAQERVWEGLDPAPLFHVGQCDDVGLDCHGLGRVIIEARVEAIEAPQS